MKFRIANEKDIDTVAALYDAACDALIEGEDSPGWEKGVYPVRQDAAQALAAGELFVVVEQGEIAGTVVLREEQEPAARSAPWQLPLAEEEQLTVYTFAVHPAHKHRGVGHAMLDGAAAWAKGQGKKALRLDVHHINTPAIRLYESCGFHFIDTVDLGYSCYGLGWFDLYERLL